MADVSRQQLSTNRPFLLHPKPLAPVFSIPFLFDYYNIDLKPVQAQLHPNLPKSDLWLYVNSKGAVAVPPVIKVRRNRAATIRWNNRLAPAGSSVSFPFIDEMQTPPMGPMGGPNCPGMPAQIGDAIVHFHGGKITPQNDGKPTQPIHPGGSKIDHYPNQQRAATYWVHDHTMDLTARNVYAGLAAFYIVEDPAEAVLQLPSGQYDWPLVIQDRIVDSSGKLVYRVGTVDPATNQRVPEFIGNLPMVNGQLLPKMQVEPTWYRLRLLNGSNTRFYNLRFHAGDNVDGSQYNTAHPDIDVWQIGSDGGLLSRPAQYSPAGLLLAPGERIELVVNFARLANSNITLYSDIAIPYQGNPGTAADYFPVMGFDVGQQVTQAQHFDPNRNLSTITPLGAAVANKQFGLFETVMNTPPNNTPMASIDNKHYCEALDPGKEHVALNSIEDWTFTNNTGDFHPMHLHLVQFQVQGGTNLIDNNGNPVMAWKDTVAVPPLALNNQTITIRAKFAPYRGEYVYHCHILEHEDMGMMRPFRVV